MVKVLTCGYATGTFSSRKLAAKLHENAALRVVRVARECGLVKLGAVAMDGTKLKANDLRPRVDRPSSCACLQKSRRQNQHRREVDGWGPAPEHALRRLQNASISI